MIATWEISLRLVLASLAGGFIGLDRERKGHPAGIRTHILLTMGSALIMMLSIDAFSPSPSGDPARLAAQVVSGIGFLCAGTIMRTSGSVHGLTTAASLWVCGGIGLAIGSGYYLGALIATLLTMVTLAILFMVQAKYFTKQQLILTVHMQQHDRLSQLLALFQHRALEVYDVEINKPQPTEIILTYHIIADKDLDRNSLVTEISNIPGVVHTGWQDIDA